MRLFFTAGLTILLAVPATLLARPVQPDDAVKEIAVSSPEISPSGDSVAYTVTVNDLAADGEVSHIWLAAWDGSGTRQLTFREGESESSPRFSPDGRQIAFLSSRGNDEAEDHRLWVMPLNGGEARPLPGITGSVSDFAWSPDGRHLALIVSDKPPEPEKDAKGEDRPRPIVIDRYHFKVDGVGYLGPERDRLWLYELATGKMQRLTNGDYDEFLPAWAPDSNRLAFVSRRAPDQDRTPDSNIYIARLDAPGAEPFRLTVYEGADSPMDAGSYPAWSPDGKQIAYVRGGDPALIWYAATSLAVIPSTGGDPRILTADLDRNVYDPVWTPDGKAVRFILEDDGAMKLASVPAGGGQVSTLLAGRFVVSRPSVARNGRTALLSSSPTVPWEVQAFDGGKLRPLSSHNAEWMKGIDFADIEYTSYRSKDGTEVRGFVMLPPHAQAGERLPTMLHPHGGPAAQYDYTFDMWQQVFAGAGYAVLTPNPRGSTGRGTVFASGIDAAWGSVDVPDVLAAVDDAVARGIADPDRLVIGGWSYGGMLTNYTIASDTRFKAAMSGAGISNILAGYGTDQYALEYDTELGVPWENADLWIRNSYPFFQNQKIVTPTLFVVGQDDVNVPTLASEQMYQALKTRGIDTQLVIYPDEDHSIDRPSFVTDLMTRWVAWYAKYLKK